MIKQASLDFEYGAKVSEMIGSLPHNVHLCIYEVMINIFLSLGLTRSRPQIRFYCFTLDKSEDIDDLVSRLIHHVSRFLYVWLQGQ